MLLRPRPLTPWLWSKVVAAGLACKVIQVASLLGALDPYHASAVHLLIIDIRMPLYATTKRWVGGWVLFVMCNSHDMDTFSVVRHNCAAWVVTNPCYSVTVFRVAGVLTNQEWPRSCWPLSVTSALRVRAAFVVRLAFQIDPWSLSQRGVQYVHELLNSEMSHAALGTRHWCPAGNESEK